MARRIEEALAECLERLESGEMSPEEALRLYPELRSELEPMLDLAAELRAMPKAQAPASLRGYKRPAFRAAPVREAWWRRLLPTGGRSLGWATPLAQAAAILAMLLLVGGGTVVASANSLPDEPLYPVKLAVENAQLTAAPTDQARAELELHFASKRLAEVESAAQQGRPDAVAKGADLYREKVESAAKTSVASGAQTEQQAEETLRQNVVALGNVLDRLKETDKNPRAQEAIQAAIDRTVAAADENKGQKDKDREKSNKPDQKVATSVPAQVIAGPSATATPTATPVATAAPVVPADTHEPPGQAKRETQQPGNSGHANPQGQEQRGQGQLPTSTVSPQDAPQPAPTATRTAPPGQRKGQDPDAVSKGNAPQKSAGTSEEDDPNGNGQKKANDDKVKGNQGNQKDFFTTIVENIQNFVRGKK